MFENNVNEEARHNGDAHHSASWMAPWESAAAVRQVKETSVCNRPSKDAAK